MVIGRTPNFAWSVTSGYDDQIDTLVVELHPEDRHKYKWNGEWHEMETESVTHKSSLRGAIVDGSVEYRVVEQEVARVVEEIDGETVVMPVVAWNKDERVAWCQRSTTRYDEADAAFQWARLGRQNDLDEFEDCISDFPFTFNFHYADEDDIAFIHTGKVPERNPDIDSRLPAPAEMHEWRDVNVGTELGAHIRNPSRGYVANWNNAPVAGWNAGDFEQRWG
ncbi:MAG: penicillin acylase family protein, partial [Halobacteria archaeon]|nr:penicillin acylase family protein [Halobacteria archaeon]